MRPKILPSEILRKRLEVIKVLLGPGWLGIPWCDWHDNSVVSTDTSLASWRNAERTYDRIAKWLIDGLAWTNSSLIRDETESGGDTAKLSESAGVPAAVVWDLRQGVDVQAAGVETRCHVSGYDLIHCIVPFLAYLYCLHDHLSMLPDDERPARCIVTLSAVPGAGKSVLAALLEHFSQIIGTQPRVQVVGMDGWHYPNEVLRAGWMKDETGQEVSLLQRKGSPPSFDIQGLVAALERLRQDPGPVDLPVYDRKLHEPVAGGVRVVAPIVLVEGNYLLMPGDEWGRIGALADAGVWLEVPLDAARTSILDRHKALGRKEEESYNKWRNNDWPNSMAALRGRSRCDAVVYEDSHRRMRFVQRLTLV